jgi:hypothetical protein
METKLYDVNPLKCIESYDPIYGIPYTFKRMFLLLLGGVFCVNQIKLVGNIAQIFCIFFILRQGLTV